MFVKVLSARERYGLWATCGCLLAMCTWQLVALPSDLRQSIVADLRVNDLERTQAYANALFLRQELSVGEGVDSRLSALVTAPHVVYAACYRGSARSADCGTIGQPRAALAIAEHPEAFADATFGDAHAIVAVVRVAPSRGLAESEGTAGPPAYLLVEYRHDDLLDQLQTWEQHAGWLHALALALAATLVGWLTVLARRTQNLIAENREALAAAQAASAAKSLFVANMSHELRTPMNGVVGMAEVLLEGELSGKQRRFVQTIRRSGKALLTIINDVLDLSRVEAGQLTLEYSEFDPRDCVEDVIELLHVKADEKGLLLAIDCDQKVPTNLLGDPNRLRQVLMNLASNAVKFTERGSVVVTVRQCKGESHGAALEFSVTDTGIGIPAEQIPKLFVPFSQGDSAMNRRFGGTGLGLYISRQLVRLMGGEIALTSEVGRGSTVSFRASFSLPEASTIAGRPHLTGLNVLLVGESDIQRRHLLQLLELWRANVTLATTVDATKKALRNSHQVNAVKFDAVLIDRITSMADSLSFASELRESGELATEHVVVFCAPGKATTADVQAAGAFALVPKPIRQAVLYDTLRKIRAQKRLLQRGTGMPDGVAPTQSGQMHLNASAGPEWMDELQATPVAPVIDTRPRPCKILVAEDNPTNTDVMLAMLEAVGYTCEVVTNGSFAVDAIKRSPDFDLVLMDCQMPQVDGYEATRQIRAFEASKGRLRVPIVAVTAHAQAEHLEEIYAAGMDAHLSKPLELANLRALIAQMTRSPHAVISPSESEADTSTLSSDVDASLDLALDHARLHQLAALASSKRPDFLSKLLRDYLDHSLPVFFDLQTAVRAGAVERVDTCAHTLAGSSDAVAAVRLGMLLRWLRQLTQQQPESIAALWPLVEREYQTVRRALQSQLRGTTALTLDQMPQEPFGPRVAS